MADLGKVTPTKPSWSRVGETMPEDNTPHPPQQPPEKEKKREEKKESDETSEENKRSSDPDDEHQIDLFV